MSNATLFCLLEYLFNFVKADVPIICHLLLDFASQHLHLPLDNSFGVPVEEFSELDVYWSLISRLMRVGISTETGW